MLLHRYILSSLSNRGTSKGFSLIELLVVVVIIGLLTAIALPTFLNQANKARQIEAQTYVKEIMQQLAIYYQENLVYPTDVSQLEASINFERINRNPDRNFTYNIKSTEDSAYAIIEAIPAQEALAGVVGFISPEDNKICSLNQETSTQRGAIAAQAISDSIRDAEDCPPPSRVIN